jgi:Rieske Fe-S protein
MSDSNEQGGKQQGSSISTAPQVDQGRRTWVAVACGAGAVGGVAAAVPFVSTFQPSERARAAGAAVEVDISDLKPGEKKTVEWRGKPVWIVKRTPEQLATLPKNDPQLADPKSQRNPDGPMGGVHVFYAPEDAAKGEWTYQRLEDQAGMNSCVGVDINNDKRKDLVCGGASGIVRWYENKGR